MDGGVGIFWLIELLLEFVIHVLSTIIIGRQIETRAIVEIGGMSLNLSTRLAK